ncbi:MULTISPECIES: hypothetical protein [Pseudomonadaceae]|uniref:hypothetical protein n=1 Tax=Pseudomonadaceae TaxID=135621 RepID=UPI001CA3EE4D|nr:MULTISPECIES: hypothetical protein [Pseudomonas]MDU9395494.1 hypothetical protein [Pseudomonas sp. zfem003]QZX85223.1 hypothetical protein K6751_11140 [Pseudomonas otitidis]
MHSAEIMSLVGSAVPETLRRAGHLACWLVVLDGAVKAGPFVSLADAQASQAIWLLESAKRRKRQSAALAA